MSLFPLFVVASSNQNKYLLVAALRHPSVCYRSDTDSCRFYNSIHFLEISLASQALLQSIYTHKCACIYPAFTHLLNDPRIDVVVVGGSHQSPTSGTTVTLIFPDAYEDAVKLPELRSSMRGPPTPSMAIPRLPQRLQRCSSALWSHLYAGSTVLPLFLQENLNLLCLNTLRSTT